MIIKLKNADFSANNIGTLSTWTITRVLGSGATYNGLLYVGKNAALNATVTISDGYELGDAGVTVTMGGEAVASGVTVDGNTITIAIASVTGNVVINVPTINTSTGEEDGGNDNPDSGNGDIGEYAIYDSFDRVNTDDGLGLTETGETWEYVVHSDHVGRALMKIHNGMVRGNKQQQYPSALVTATELDRYVEVEIAINAGEGQILLYSKFQDTTNYVAVKKAADGIITLVKKVNNTNIEIAKTTEKYTDDNLIIAIQCIGNNHTVFVNGTQIITGTISECASATKVGFCINGTTDMLDNFKVKYL